MPKKLRPLIAAGVLLLLFALVNWLADSQTSDSATSAATPAATAKTESTDQPATDRPSTPRPSTAPSTARPSTAPPSSPPSTARPSATASAPPVAPASPAPSTPARSQANAPPAPPSGLPTIARSDLPREAIETLADIASGGPYDFRKDDSVFHNRERLLPNRKRGHYREYTVVTPGVGHRGARRIVSGADGELYYTSDHYASFEEIRP